MTNLERYLEQIRTAVYGRDVREAIYRSILEMYNDFITWESGNLFDNSVTTPKLADGAVTTPKIANKAVTTPKINDEAVTSVKLAPNAVTSAKLEAALRNTITQLVTDVANLNDHGITISESVVSNAVDAWLDSHPSATTSIPDNSITDAKLIQSGGILDRTSTFLTSQEIDEMLNAEFYINRLVGDTDMSSVPDLVRYFLKIANIPYRYESAPFGAWKKVIDGVNSGGQSITCDGTNLYIASAVGSTTSGGYIAKINLTTGQLVTEETGLPIGHANGLAWCNNKLYIACAGGTNGRNGVAIYTSMLTQEDYIDFTDRAVTNPYGIASDGTKIWLLVGGGKLVEMNANLTAVTKEVTLTNMKPTLQPWLPTRTGQTMFWYNNMLFVVMQYQSTSTNPWGLTYFAVYDDKTLEHLADVPCIGLGEFEDGCIYNDTILTLVNTSGYAFIVQGGLKRDSSAFGWATLSDTAPANVGSRGQMGTENIYIKIDNDSTFFSNGTEQYPFKQWWHYVQYSLLKTQGSTQQIYIDGIFDGIVIRDCDFSLRIAGWGDGCTMEYIILDNTDSVLLDSITFTPNNHDAIMATHCQYLYARNITVNGIGDRLIGATGTVIEFENLTVSGTFGAMVSTDSQIRFSGTTNFTNANITGAYYFPHSIAWPTTDLPSTMSFVENERAARLNNQAIDFGSTRFAADETFSCVTGCTFTHGPDAGMTSCKFHCTFMDGMNIFQLVRTDLSAVNLYLGVSARNGNCTWTRVI